MAALGETPSFVPPCNSGGRAWPEEHQAEHEAINATTPLRALRVAWLLPADIAPPTAHIVTPISTVIGLFHRGLSVPEGRHAVV